MTKRVTQMLQMLPKDITPVNLEELRRVKQNLVELESKADTLRQACLPMLTAPHCRLYPSRERSRIWRLQDRNLRVSSRSLHFAILGWSLMLIAGSLCSLI